MLRVKICGNRTAEELALAVRLGADAVGLIVGVRHPSEDVLAPSAAAALLEAVPVFVNSVLVTHLVTAAAVLRLHAQVPASVIQLHDAIAVEEIAAIRRTLPHIALIKAIGITGENAVAEARRYAPHVAALLLDSRSGARIGGTGRVHDWSISRCIVAAVDKPVILAGGLRPENLREAVAAVRPYGVDVNSGVERPGGGKDPARVRAFIRLAKSLEPRS